MLLVAGVLVLRVLYQVLRSTCTISRFSEYGGEIGIHYTGKSSRRGLVLSSVANLVHLCGEDVGSNPVWTISSH